MTPESIAVIIVAAGKGERVSRDAGADPKQYRTIGGVSVLIRTIRAFLDHPQITSILTVIHPDHAERYAALGLSDDRMHPPVIGGSNRQASVLAGLQALEPLQPDLVLIHDAARPFAGLNVIGDVIDALEQYDGALPALSVTDTIKRSLDGRHIVATEDRQQLVAAQTPQGFHFTSILAAHMRAAKLPRQFTDDAEIAEWAGLKLAMVMGDPNNIKLTLPGDFDRAERMLFGDLVMETRIGIGFDVHSFVPGDHVWLGGVRIPYRFALNGHSDSDVALHALTDAIYGAIGVGDIGVHFPPSDAQWKGAASTLFLKHAGELVAWAQGWIVNLDVTIICEGPKIAPHVPAMQGVIAETLRIAPSRIAVKATTSEKLGFTGRDEGIVAMASASIEMPRTH
ncbi:MAG: bifunctional 2-C-methyl-D-erythritol 4-phosphate cytidylyltransferase/2-C-methyl-D-erythritol 2,4-cyclodiphosphate synthase [Candidatus Devosia symbiotica]|nr:bifunctional 2-C-methyl-D-erythritol 4-phosphate cytidylyltransferase/2-C-methyl-D-erythritol 2,4-cyclodiphosphate synthase [Candidatus Devosia symbiotica]